MLGLVVNELGGLGLLRVTSAMTAVIVCCVRRLSVVFEQFVCYVTSFSY